MPRLRKCKVCGIEFISHNGKITCSDLCSLEYKRLKWSEANYKRKRGLSGTKEKKICPFCGIVFEGLNRTYCSKECSDNSAKVIRKEISDQYYKDNRRKVINRVKERRKEKR